LFSRSAVKSVVLAGIKTINFVEIIFQIYSRKFIKLEEINLSKQLTMSIVNGHARWAFDFKSWKPTLQELMSAVSLIQPEEKERISKFVFVEDFKGSLAGRLLIRHYVRCALCIDNDRFKLGRDERNKPHLSEIDGLSNRNDKSIDFNISHQGSFACLAGYIGNEQMRLGVDVMKIEYGGGKPLQEFFRLMTRNFCSNEWNYIKSFDTEHRQLRAFIRTWCLKESYVKNVGIGITMNLQKLDFIINSRELNANEIIADTKLKLNGELLSDFHFEESLIDDEHCVAVSLKNKTLNVTNHQPTKFELIEFEELIRNAKPLSTPDEKYCAEILRKETKEKC
jgi:phosphopantetheine--protein transferase-like protein